MSREHVVADADIDRFLGAHDTQGAALRSVARPLETSGDAYAQDLAVGLQTDDGDFVDVLSGEALLARVKEVAAARESAARGRPGSGAPSGAGGTGSGECFGAIAAKGWTK